MNSTLLKSETQFETESLTYESLSLQEKARRFMEEHGYFYEGDFPETGEGQQEKFNGEEDRRDKRSWLRTRYLEGNSGKPGLCITFGRHDGCSDRKTKTFWEDEGAWSGLSEKEKIEIKTRQGEEKRKAKERAEKEKAFADELANQAIDRFGKACDQPPYDAVTYFSKKGMKNPHINENLRWEREYDCDSKSEKWIAIAALRDKSGNIRAIQELLPEKKSWDNGQTYRNKNNFGKTGGTFFCLGRLENRKPIYICEGVATAYTIFDATKKTTIAALSNKNLGKAAKDLKAMFPESEIVICADNDHHRETQGTGNPGLDEARKIALENGFKLALPRFPDKDLYDTNGDPRTDFDDLRQLQGNEEVKKQIDFASVPEKTEGLSQEEQTKNLSEFLRKNEIGDADLFCAEFGGKYLFDPTEGKNGTFYFWNGSHWASDIHKNRYKDFEKIAEHYEAAATENEPLEKEFKKRANQLRTSRRRSNVLETVSGKLSFKDCWDNNPNKLPCLNGIIDLSSGKLEQSSPGQYIKKVCPVSYNESAKCPNFDKFLDDVTLGDTDLKSFLQVLFGYCAIGIPREEKIFIFYGEEGRNGKGTLMQAVQSALGPLSKTFPSELLLLQRNPPSSSSPSPELANLEGTRLAIFSEINKGRKIDSAKVKNLSGRDVIPCRRLYSNVDLQITPSHTMILQTNYKPSAPSEDSALWSRNVLVPFKARFVPNPKQAHERPLDEKFKDLLQKESQGILNWIVEGSTLYNARGLHIPQSILAETDKYREENDVIGMFIRDCCTKGSDLKFGCRDFQTDVKDYAKSEGLEIPTRNAISAYMKDRYQKKSDSSGNFWIGITITPTMND